MTKNLKTLQSHIDTAMAAADAAVASGNAGDWTSERTEFAWALHSIALAVSWVAHRDVSLGDAALVMDAAVKIATGARDAAKRSACRATIPGNVRALVAKWRDEASERRSTNPTDEYAATLSNAADELEIAIAAESSTMISIVPVRDLSVQGHLVDAIDKAASARSQ